MQTLILDNNDLKILNLLARNGRLSYRNISSTIGLTTKSVKSRVDKMISKKVIERFIAQINPSILGYKTICNFVIRNDMLNRDLLERISLVGDIHYQFYVMGGVEGFIMMVNDGSEQKIELLLKSLQPFILGITIQRCDDQKIADKLTITDYHIIRQLVCNPRMEMLEIGKNISTSSRTVRRRIDKMSDRYHILEFTTLPNPHAMKGQIVFFLSLKVESAMYDDILTKIFSRLHYHIILSLMTHDQKKETIGLNLASEDVFKIESIRSQIQSLRGVKEANVFLPIKIQYNEGVIMKAIERQIKKIERNKAKHSI
ncbi:MAG: AsnC family transcriptional regulator [Nitrososphaeraceae archaeon]